jgi:hypothetical protein
MSKRRVTQVQLSQIQGTVAVTWPYAPRAFRTVVEALKFAEEKGRPIYIFMAGAEDKANDKLFKLHPTGRIDEVQL